MDATLDCPVCEAPLDHVDHSDTAGQYYCPQCNPGVATARPTVLDYCVTAAVLVVTVLLAPILRLFD